MYGVSIAFRLTDRFGHKSTSASRAHGKRVSIAFRLTDGFGPKRGTLQWYFLKLVSIAFRLTDGFGHEEQFLAIYRFSETCLNCLSAY